MTITLPLDEMTTDEKLRVMEALWADLSRTEEAAMTQSRKAFSPVVL
ncbi:MAG: hypothetical protein U0587_06300 [Candidatus Binatia bacterium]